MNEYMSHSYNGSPGKLRVLYPHFVAYLRCSFPNGFDCFDERQLQFQVTVK